MTKFWDGVGGKLAERWATVSLPALVFWLGGALAWTHHRGGLRALAEPAAWLGRQPGGVQAVVLVAGLLGVAASGILVDRLTRPALALLEGYWPRPLHALRRRLTDRIARRARADEATFQALAEPVHTGTATADQRDRYARIDRQIRRRPAPQRLMPTYVGNVLRAGETRPIDKYGLDAVALWPHLWLLLPETTRGELAAARRSLEASVGAGVWGLLFLAFTPWSWFAAPLGIGVALLAVRAWVPARAEVFADLVEASFDLYRPALYSHLRWPMPTDPADERAVGRRVTTYLLRGLSGSHPTFTTADQQPAGTSSGSASTGGTAQPAAPGKPDVPVRADGDGPGRSDEDPAAAGSVGNSADGVQQ